MKHPLDHSELTFLDRAFPLEERLKLTVSASTKVPCVCDRCQVSRPCTFFSVYRQWKTRGEYICRSCQAKVNGQNFTEGSLEKRRVTSLQKYGVTHYLKRKDLQPKDSNIEKYIRAHPHPMHVEESRQKLQATNMAKYGVPYTTVLPQCQSTLTTKQYSQGEIEVREFLQSITKTDWPATWAIISPKQLDGWNAITHQAFEYCGLYWHSEACGKTRQTHAEKLRLCHARGIRLYTIYDDEWRTRQTQVQDFLRSQCGIFERRIGARDTSIRPIDPTLAASTISDWHIQPLKKYPSHAWGLWDRNDILLAVMSFGPHHRYSEYRDIVLNRFVTAPHVQIIGGASKLLAAAIQAFSGQYSSIVSWSDNRWSDGHVYTQMGFSKDGELAPEYDYTNGRIRIPKQACTRKKLHAAPGQTEYDKAKELGLTRIWDCGKIRWRYFL